MVVTGGAGFLGSRLARELLAAGSLPVAGHAGRPVSRLTLIDQAPAPPDLAADSRVAVVRGDLVDLLGSGGAARDVLAGPARRPAPRNHRGRDWDRLILVRHAEQRSHHPRLRGR